MYARLPNMADISISTIGTYDGLRTISVPIKLRNEKSGGCTGMELNKV